MKAIFDSLRQRQPQFFSGATLQISGDTREAMSVAITAIESVISLPSFQAHVLAQAPALARLPVKSAGVFMGYDFHLTEDGPRLIEINTNAGGGLLNLATLSVSGGWGDLADGFSEAPAERASGSGARHMRSSSTSAEPK